MQGISIGDNSVSAMIAMNISIMRFSNLYIVQCWPLLVVRCSASGLNTKLYGQRSTNNEQRFLKHFFYLITNSLQIFISNICRAGDA